MDRQAKAITTVKARTLSKDFMKPPLGRLGVIPSSHPLYATALPRAVLHSSSTNATLDPDLALCKSMGLLPAHLLLKGAASFSLSSSLGSDGWDSLSPWGRRFSARTSVRR